MEQPVTEVPPELELVRSFVNTLDVEAATDELATVGGLRSWLVGHDLLAAGDEVGRRDVALAIELRDAIRRALLVHAGVPAPPDDLDRLNLVAARLALQVHFDADGAPTLVPRGDGASAALARLLAHVAESRAAGTWERLKVCPAEDCLWGFYDQSRNRSRRWCSMEVCGNRTKTRAYRRRNSG